jgi:two-component system cell cycle response regulator
MKILIAEDDTTSRLLFSATLRKLGHTVTAVEDGRKAWEAWIQNDYSLLISDWMMPHVDGLQLCRMVRAEPTLQYTYIILLTAMDSKGSYLEGMDAGADDFITKPLDEEHLAARLRVAERILGLHKKLHIVADLDHFKRINDTLGHAAGDAVLQEAACRMKGALRSDDNMGRYGGEEFLITTSGSDRSQTMALAESIRRAVNLMPVISEAGEIAITVSLGVAMNDSKCEDAGRLIAAADEALYRAKKAGRNRVEYYDGTL